MKRDEGDSVECAERCWSNTIPGSAAQPPRDRLRDMQHEPLSRLESILLRSVEVGTLELACFVA